jgi:hypothetical protein
MQYYLFNHIKMHSLKIVFGEYQRKFHFSHSAMQSQTEQNDLTLVFL